MHRVIKPFIWLLKKSKSLSALSCHLTKWSGQSKYPIHPKHLITKKPWFINYINKKDQVLDLGCGNGQHTIKTAKKCKKIVGLDNSNKNIDIAKKNILDLGLKNIKIQKHNLENKLLYKKSSFDKIICLDVLEHINNRKQLLDEIKRILKVNGLLFLAVPNKNTTWKKMQKKAGLNYYSDPDHKIEYSYMGIRKFIDLTGLNIQSLKPTVYDTPFVGFFDLIGGISPYCYKRILNWRKNKLDKNFNETTGFRITVKK